MLFTSWRNEERDLIGNYSSYKEHYQSLETSIKDQLNLYAVCDEELNNAQEQLNSAIESSEDHFDSIAPVTQDTERQDEEEGSRHLHADLNENYDLSHDIGIPSFASNNEPLILNELPDDEYRAMVQKLNKEQKEFFYHILHLIKTSDKPFYSFLSGGGGVGKSHLTKSIYQAALKYYNTQAGEDFTQIRVLLLAPTGKAAFIIQANTIHSVLAVPACQSLKKYKPLDCNRLNTIKCQLGGVKLILIDEISMIGNAMFNVQINNRLKDIKGSKEDFGGVSIIAIGDLFQLDPVMDSFIFKDFDNSEYGILTPNLWKKHFRMFELGEIMRQRESRIFAEILNRLREGNQTESDISIIKQRIVAEENCPRQAPHLFIQNAMVDKFNDEVYKSATGKKYIIQCHDSVIGANSEELRDRIMKQIPNDPRRTKQLVSKLHIAEGERTEIAINVRTDDGLTNGASNIVKLVQLNQPGKPSAIIWVKFDLQSVGRKTRHENRQLYQQNTQNIQSSWTPVKPVTTQFAVGRNRTAQVVRKQFSLRLAAAKTVHRSQDDTQAEIVVNLNTRKKIPHIHYVALSRVTTIEGLYITDLCEEKLAVHPDVVTEMQELRGERSLQLSISPLYKISDISLLKLCYLNSRSLHKHIEDVRKDFNTLNSDIAVFTETRMTPTESNEMYIIDGFELFRNDSLSSANNGRPYYGTAVYSRVPLVSGYPSSHNINGIEFTMIKIESHPNLTIVAIYRSPKIPINYLCSTLSEVLLQVTSDDCIIIGDFNVNWFSETLRRPLYNLMVRDNGYLQLISDYTTDIRTLIDHIFCKMTSQAVNSGVLETYFSDHKTIWISFK